MVALATNIFMLQSQPLSAFIINMTNEPKIIERRTQEAAPLDLQNFWPYQAVVLADQIGRRTLAIVRDRTDLNLSQWRVLAAIGEKPGRTAAEVTTLTPMDKTIVSRAVTALLEGGYIEKTPDKNDKRRVSLRTTPTGEAVFLEIARTLNEAMVETLDSTLSPQDFIADLKRYTDALKVTSKTP